MPLAKIAQKSELPAVGEAKEFLLDEKVICIANVGGEYSAMDNVCLHHGGPMGQGIVEQGKVICPWHGWQYDPKTGELGHNSNVRIPVYPLKIDGEDVLVDV
jgi:nitrite reductase (NADH) small subunit